jgi:hypothetical protein
MPVARDVVRAWDPHTDPPKWKWHICVCPRRRLFLRINSEAIFRPCHPIARSLNDFLEHDSYVELQSMVRLTGRTEHLGRMSLAQARGLVEAVWEAETLTRIRSSLSTQSC